MQSKWEYEYAIIRLVPKVERAEFINIGLLVMCKPKKYICAQYELDKTRILSFAPYLAIEELEKQLPAFIAIANGDKKGGLIASLPVHERFRWMTARRSTIIQTSPVHGGITHDINTLFDQLYKEYVTIPTDIDNLSSP